MLAAHPSPAAARPSVPAAARRSCPFVQTRVIRSPHSCRVQAGSNNSVGREEVYETVADAMTSGHIHSCGPDDTVDAALEMLVQHRITGLPVLDPTGHVVGVVSDYDLLALDQLGQTNNDKQLFPQADETWQAFKEVKRLLAKSSGKKVKDVMTATPITVRPETGLDEAATVLLSKKIHRLPVVNGEGKLVGVLSRGNLVKAALAVRKAAAQQNSN